MLESICCLRRYTAPEDQLCGLKLFQRGSKFDFSQPGHRSQQFIGELAAQSSAYLRRFLGWAQTVKPRQQRVVEGRWDCQCRQPLRQDIATAGLTQELR